MIKPINCFRLKLYLEDNKEDQIFLVLVCDVKDKRHNHVSPDFEIGIRGKSIIKREAKI